MKISIDLDGVLLDYVSSFKKYFLNEYGITQPDQFDYNFNNWNLLDKNLGHHLEQMVVLDYVRHIKPYSLQYSSFIQELRKEHIVIFNTSRGNRKSAYNAFLIRDTISSLWIFGLDFDEIHFGNKSSVNFDLHVDDYADELQKLRLTFPERKLIKVEQPWNLHETSFDTVNDITEIVKFL